MPQMLYVVAMLPAPGCVVIATADADEATAVQAKYEAQNGAETLVLVEKTTLVLSDGKTAHRK